MSHLAQSRASFSCSSLETFISKSPTTTIPDKNKKKGLTDLRELTSTAGDIVLLCTSGIIINSTLISLKKKNPSWNKSFYPPFWLGQYWQGEVEHVVWGNGSTETKTRWFRYEKCKQKTNETSEREAGSSLATPSSPGLLLYLSIFIRAGDAPAAAAPTVTALVLLGLAAGWRRRCRLLLLLLQRRRLLLLFRVALHVSTATLHLVKHSGKAHRDISIGLSYGLLQHFSERASAALASSSRVSARELPQAPTANATQDMVSKGQC